MKRGLSVAALLGVLFGAGSVAWGQTEIVTVAEPTTKFNIENCQNESFSFTVTFTNTTTYQYKTGAPYEVWLARGTGCTATDNDPSGIVETACAGAGANCCEKIAGGTVGIDATGAEAKNIGPLDIADFFDCSAEAEGSFTISVFTQPGLKYNTLTYIFDADTEWQKKDQTVNYDFKRPTPPAVPDVQAGETSLEISWTALDETLRYRAYASQSDFDVSLPVADQRSLLTGLAKSALTSAADTSATITGLQAMTPYFVTVVSVDEEDNESLPSPSTEASTVEVTDFYELYRRQGGSDTGGYCAVAGAEGQAGVGGAGCGLLLGVLGLSLARRRRRSVRRATLALGLATLALGVVLGASTAQAESPRIMTMSLSAGAYQPQIDDEFHSSAGDGPYRKFFGDDSATLWRLDLGWDLFDQFGTLNAGIGMGYGSVSAKGFVQGSETRSTEDSTLRLLPVNASLTYAFDYLAQRWSFPLVPFGSAGLDYMFYWIYDGAGDVATNAGSKGEGKGGLYGYHGSFGLRLLLDVFATDMAQSFDMDMGVNNSYLFAEYLMTSINNFGDSNRFNMSSSGVFFGLAFDF